MLKNNMTSSNPKAIMDELKSFYSDLYNNRSEDDTEEFTNPFLNDPQIPKLSKILRNACEGQLTVTECFNTLSSFKNNKTPGNDGLTVEFYKAFWNQIGNVLVDCLNYSHEHGELSTSQKQALIILLEKENRDRRFIKNWRPISSINVDAKIGSKAIAKRLEKTLPTIIHYNQNAYVKGRTMFDAARTIDDILDFCKAENESAILTTLDFEKAFDSLKWDHLIGALKAFDFGPSFISWVKTFYKNSSSCVANNGFSTSYSPLKRGVRQGDPLSPYLFIIGLELLAIHIRNDKEINGLTIGKEEVKVVIYADDMTCFLKNKQSYHSLMKTLNRYSICSGLRINREKTKILLLGPEIAVSKEQLDVKEIRMAVKILGFHFTYNNALFRKLNFDSIMKSIKKSLNNWKWRVLTLMGKIQIIKSFVVPRILYRAAVLPLEKDFLKESLVCYTSSYGKARTK